MNVIDVNFSSGFMEGPNVTDFNVTCTSEDCIILESISCPNMLNKTILTYTLAIFYIFIFVIGLLANSMVIWLSLQTKITGYETHLYIFNLAIADLCVVLTLPFWVVSMIQYNQWTMGEFICKITHFIFSINLFSSIFFLTCMSVDRYLSVIFFPASSTCKRKIVRQLICFFVWLLAFSVSIPDTYFLKTIFLPSTNETVCRPMYPEDTFKEWMIGMELVSVALGFIIPFPIITVFYCLLAKTISASNDQERNVSSKIIFSYVIVFLVCWLPYHGVVLLDIFSALFMSFSCHMESFLYVALHITQCFSLIHCCINPILYSFINRNYRYELMKAFIFKYSAKTGLTKLIDASKVSETEYTVVDQNAK
uniref:Atypical chemokine receptor 3 n=1 Tax=Geotrypetes seraphini TaxID=260995 RepID=A0A6P8QY13_GEOSA|nr:atypical chemokine receptor 3 [Geotrypetes seraphini]XP_033802332.1 atypical chemokine receptor 3 [Geotrypetes seraphini]XP_033802333.1 atypical chemokine receptor 3 [Geotrypetes seraphini]XP_033802334.1 atypical chemokine receptor 3 [Geotrypetes seraphini]